MHANLTAVIAADRHERYLADAAEHRRVRGSRRERSGALRPAPSRRRRIGAFLKDLAAAAL